MATIGQGGLLWKAELMPPVCVGHVATAKGHLLDDANGSLVRKAVVFTRSCAASAEDQRFEPIADVRTTCSGADFFAPSAEVAAQTGLSRGAIAAMQHSPELPLVRFAAL